MFINYSPSTNGSLPSQPYSFSMDIYHHLCFDLKNDVYTYTAYCLTYSIVTCPLCTLILLMGCQRWKQCHSSTATISHSDFLTYNMAVVDLIGVLGALISVFGSFVNLPDITVVGVLIGGFPWTAQMLFPILVCVERYLAVVHPITYLRLRHAGGIRIRNITTVLVWLHSFVAVSLIAGSAKYPTLSCLPAFVIVLCLLTATFCSLAILCVLIRPRPGEAAGDGAQADQSKRKAFKIVVLILGVLLCKFVGQLIFFVVHSLATLSRDIQCAVTASTVWFNLPSSLVLPLLFLYRAVKLTCCKQSTESGSG